MSFGGIFAAALLIQACTFVPDGELSPKDSTLTHPAEGIVVGVVVIAADGGAPFGLGTVDETALILRQPGNLDHRLHLLPAYGDASVREGGIAANARPFAFRLVAGPAQFQAMGVRFVGDELTGYKRENVCNWFVSPPKCEWKHVPVYRHYDYWRDRRLPPAGFEVKTRAVTYIGRIGLAMHSVSYGSRQERDAACSEKGRAKLSTGWTCYFQQLVVGSDPDTDLPLIRKRYPGLGPLEIERQPLQFQPGTWRTIGEARQAPDYD